MNYKPIILMALVLWLVNFIMGFLGGWIPNLGNAMLNGIVSLVITAALVLWFWKYIKGTLGDK